MLEVDDDCDAEEHNLTSKPAAPSRTEDVRLGKQAIDPHLLDSISEMGFEKKQVEIVVKDMQRSGSKLDVDTILGALLNGADSSMEESPRKSPKSSPTARSQSARWEDEQDERYARKMKENMSTSTSSLMKRGGQLDNSVKSDNSTTIEITPGQFAQLLKGRQTWNAMHNGTAVVAVCIICDTKLQCCPEADYVLCPDCNVVSPLSNGGMRKGPSSRSRSMGAVGLGYKKGGAGCGARASA